MTNSPDPDAVYEHWQDTFQEMNQQLADTLTKNLESQTRFIESWLDAVGETMDDDQIESALDGYRRAYETWMETAQETFERSIDTLEGEDVPFEEARDAWLNAANQSFKELMGTTAFASATGQSVEESLNLRQTIEEATEDAVHEFGLAARSDVREAGERLVELERRQHAVEQKLDDVLEALDTPSNAQ